MINQEPPGTDPRGYSFGVQRLWPVYLSEEGAGSILKPAHWNCLGNGVGFHPEEEGTEHPGLWEGIQESSLRCSIFGEKNTCFGMTSVSAEQSPWRPLQDSLGSRTSPSCSVSVLYLEVPRQPGRGLGWDHSEMRHTAAAVTESERRGARSRRCFHSAHASSLQYQ